MKNNTLKQWLTRCFALIIIFSAISLSIWDFSANYDANVESREHRAIACAKVIDKVLDNIDLDSLKDDSAPRYQKIRSLFHTLCKAFAMDYVYIYRIDPETQYRHYLFCTAQSDEQEEIVKRERSLGAISTDPLDPEEVLIMNGETQIQKNDIDNNYGHEVTWLIPYLSEDDKLLAIIGIDFNIEKGYSKVIYDFCTDSIPLLLPMLLGVTILLIFVHRRITKPLARISASMSHFAKDARNKPENLGITREDEIGEIATTFDKMAADISQYINNIEALTKERVENNVQLEVARRIQYGLVPEKKEIDSKAFCVSALTRPAKAVGGDFYDCFQRDDDTMCILIGDVSGKGVSAAIFMSMAKTMIREKMMAGCSPAQALNYANDEMCIQNPENLFATTFAAVLNSKTGEICYANAGHTEPVLLKEEPEFLKMDSGIALGLFENAGLTDCTITLSENQGILLYTDGITEANDMQNTFFGTERLIEAIKSTPPSAEHVNDTVNAVLKSVLDFSAGKEQFDDTAILAAYFKPLPKTDAQPLPVEVSSLDIIKKNVFNLIGENAQARKIMLVCDEILANIVNYSKATELSFTCEKGDSIVSVAFSDNGIAFDPTAAKSPEKEFDMLDTGGMGLNVIRMSSKEMRYERKDDRNILTVHFELE